MILEAYYEFCDLNNINSEEIKKLHGKIYGRMQHLEDCMKVSDFYSEKINIFKKEYPLEYHIIYIDDSRKENRDSLELLLNSNKLNIKCLNAKKENALEKFKLDNPEFKFGWDGFKLGEIGNFGSHYLAWKYLANSDLNSLVVFEDDIIASKDFIEKYQLAMNSVPEDYDVFSIYVDSNQHPRFDESQSISYYIAKGYQDWSTLGYVISKRGAKKLCKYVEKFGMDHPTDWFIFRKGHQGIFNVYTFPPYIENPLSIDSRYESQVQ
jgi:GR25 family glycosyltransferase involved in LPS biosynthesis